MRTLPLTRQEARLLVLVLVLERAPKYWFKPADQLPVEDQLFHLYEKLHLFSDSPEVGE
jgi:hypothetical protein